MMSARDLRSYAGLLAASSTAVAKQLPSRDPFGGGGAPRVRPARVSDLPRLFADNGDSASTRVERVSTAALLYSVDKQTTAQANKVLRNGEIEVLKDLHQQRQPHFKTDRSCPHCRLLHGALYLDPERWRAVPPIAVLNHRAHVAIEFDPDTNVASAEIQNFQVLVPKRVARAFIDAAHPLHWADRPGSPFQRCDAVEADGTTGTELRGDRRAVQDTWERRTRAGDDVYILENVAWPLNGSLSADAENVIAIHRFQRTDDSIGYGYSLEKCVRTNFGIAWEPSGLDIDAGEFQARVVPVADLADAVDDQEVSFAAMRRRDLVEMDAIANGGRYEPGLYFDRSVSDALYRNKWASYSDLEAIVTTEIGTVPADPDAVEPAAVVQTVTALSRRLEAVWGDLAEPFCLVDVTASKRLHFTIPENNPVELWHLLTWTAPAMLFALLTKLVCHAPHVLIDELIPRRAGLATTV